MIPLLMALMLAPGSGSIGDTKFMLRDPQQGPTPVTDKLLRPSRPPDCKTDEETRHAVQQVRNGEIGDCFVKDVAAFNRH